MSGAEAAKPGQIDQEISLLDAALVVIANIRLLVIVPLVTGVVALAICFLVPQTYTATARILPPGQQQNASAMLASQFGAFGGLASLAASIKNPADQYAALLRSQSVYDSIIRRFNLKVVYDERYIESARKELADHTEISAGPKDGLISIEIEDHDAKRAADIANAFVDELRTLTKSLALSEAAQRRLFFEEQLKQAKEALTDSEQALRSSAVSEATLRTVPQAALETLARLKAQITVQEIKLASMRAFMTDANPEVKLAIQELGALRTALGKAEESNGPTGSGKGAEYIAKYRDFKYQETLFELMAKQYEVARLDEARDGAVIQVVDIAKPAERSSKPRKAMITGLATLASLLLTLFFVFLRNAVRNLARHEPEFAHKVSRLRRLVQPWRTDAH